jgi:hypothetical protein
MRDCQVVEPYNRDLDCPICLHIVQDPAVSTKCCEKLLCRDCTAKVPDFSCPCCKKEYLETTEKLNRIVRNLLNRTQLICHRCEEKVPYLNFQEHKGKCIENVKCFRCNYCDIEGLNTKQQLKTHIEIECQQLRTVECKKCSMLLRGRKELEEHTLAKC